MKRFPEVFLDTSAWVAALNRRERAHAEALEAYEQLLNRGGRFLSSNLVLAEVHVLLLRHGGPRAALRFLEAVREDPAHEVVYVDRATEAAATDRWLRRFDDQPFSLADAVSFELMRQRKVGTALTLDRHFRVAGFEMLPRGA